MTTGVRLEPQDCSSTLSFSNTDGGNLTKHSNTGKTEVAHDRDFPLTCETPNRFSVNSDQPRKSLFLLLRSVSGYGAGGWGFGGKHWAMTF